MKKIYCDWNIDDFLKLEVVDCSDVIVTVKQNGNKSKVRINPFKIRKLRKQLKRALIEIEGGYLEEKKDQDKGDDWFSVGKTVKVIGNSNAHRFPIGEIVRIDALEKPDVARAEYLDGHDYWWICKGDCEPA